jgi:hypothetical protein
MKYLQFCADNNVESLRGAKKMGTVGEIRGFVPVRSLPTRTVRVHAWLQAVDKSRTFPGKIPDTIIKHLSGLSNPERLAVFEALDGVKGYGRYTLLKAIADSENSDFVANRTLFVPFLAKYRVLDLLRFFDNGLFSLSSGRLDAVEYVYSLSPKSVRVQLPTTFQRMAAHEE